MLKQIDYDVPPTRRMADKARQLRALATLAMAADRLHRIGHALYDVGAESDGSAVQAISYKLVDAMDKLEVPDLTGM